MKTTNTNMTTNSQLPTTETKKQRPNKLSKQLEQEENHRNGDHMEGYQWGGVGVEWGKVQRIRSIIVRYKTDRGRLRIVQNSIENGEPKDLICMIHGHELRGGGTAGGQVLQGGGE